MGKTDGWSGVFGWAVFWILASVGHLLICWSLSFSRDATEQCRLWTRIGQRDYYLPSSYISLPLCLVFCSPPHTHTHTHTYIYIYKHGMLGFSYSLPRSVLCGLEIAIASLVYFQSRAFFGRRLAFFFFRGPQISILDFEEARDV
jgi:hypothetical protein